VEAWKRGSVEAWKRGSVEVPNSGATEGHGDGALLLHCAHVRWRVLTTFGARQGCAAARAKACLPLIERLRSALREACCAACGLRLYFGDKRCELSWHRKLCDACARHCEMAWYT
jgi:hypothetical protein